METDVCIGGDETLRQAGHRMRELGVTALAVRGAGGASHGIVSQDMIVRRIAAGGDPAIVTVAELTPAAARPGGAAVTGEQAALAASAC